MPGVQGSWSCQGDTWTAAITRNSTGWFYTVTLQDGSRRVRGHRKAFAAVQDEAALWINLFIEDGRSERHG